MDERKAKQAIEALWDAVSEALDGKPTPGGGNWGEHPIGQALGGLREDGARQDWPAAQKNLRAVEEIVSSTRELCRDRGVHKALKAALFLLDMASEEILLDGQLLKLRRVEVVFYVATQHDEGRARAEIQRAIEREDVMDLARITDATPETVDADSWEQLLVYGVDGEHYPAEFFVAAAHAGPAQPDEADDLEIDFSQPPEDMGPDDEPHGGPGAAEWNAAASSEDAAGAAPQQREGE